MGLLHRVGTEARHTLTARVILGRSTGCEVTVAAPCVSGEHAALRFHRGRWQVRDLASRNGTFLRGERLEAGPWHDLHVGDTLGLGSAEVCVRLEDDGPPTAFAREVATGRLVPGDSEVVVLPDEDLATVIVRSEGGRWVVDDGEDVRPVQDLDVLTVDGRAFVIHLPVVLDATVEDRSQLVLDDMAVQVRVSPDQEHVRTVLRGAGRDLELTPRSYHYLVAVLAAAHRDDAEQPAEERGWRDAGLLAHDLRVSKRTLDVQVCRIRAQVRDLGVVGSDRFLERRGSELRLGVADVQVVGL